MKELLAGAALAAALLATAQPVFAQQAPSAPATPVGTEGMPATNHASAAATSTVPRKKPTRASKIVVNSLAGVAAAALVAGGGGSGGKDASAQPGPSSP